MSGNDDFWDEKPEDLPLDQKIKMAQLANIQEVTVSMRENTRMQTEAHEDRITLWDFYAGQALASCCAKYGPKDAALAACSYVNEMIKERSKWK